MRINKHSKKIAASVLAVFTFLATVPQAHADWVDSWFQQKTSTSPGYYKGQQAGYFTGGSFSARYQTGSEALASFQSPRMSVGCGGVDIFMGSMKFMDLDHLIQKLKTIMMSGGTMFVFDLAMKTYCPQCAETLAKIESMLERLNGIQLDDCKAAKALAADLTASATSKSLKTEALDAYAQSTGAYELRDDFNKVVTAAKGKNPAAGATNQPNKTDSSQESDSMKKDCSVRMKNYYYNGGSVLRKKAKELNIDGEVIEVVRAIIGDVVMQPTDDKSWNPQYIPVCPKANALSAEDFLDKKYVVRKCSTDASVDFMATQAGAWPPMLSVTTCTCEPVIGESYSTKFLNDFVAIRDAMVNKHSLNDSMIQRINELPLPIYRALKVSIATQQSDATISTLSQLAAKAYAYRMMNDMLTITKTLVSQARADIDEAKKPAGDPKKCDISSAVAVGAALSDADKSLTGLVQGLQSKYNAEVTETLSTFQMSQAFKQYEDVYKKVLGNRILPKNVVDRINSPQ